MFLYAIIYILLNLLLRLCENRQIIGHDSPPPPVRRKPCEPWLCNEKLRTRHATLPGRVQRVFKGQTNPASASDALLKMRLNVSGAYILERTADHAPLSAIANRFTGKPPMNVGRPGSGSGKSQER
jgi:hypothetical protein